MRDRSRGLAAGGLVVVLLAALLVGACEEASAAQLYVCMDDTVESGAPYFDCWEERARYVDSSWVPRSSGWLIFVCDSTAVVGTGVSCAGSGYNSLWVAASAVSGSMAVWDEIVSGWVSLDDVEFAGGSGGEEPGEGPVIDVEMAAQSFGVGFALVALFWALGHAVSIVLGLLK